MKKDVLYRLSSMSREPFEIAGYRFGSGKPKLAVVGASRGSEIQALYVAARLVNFLEEHESSLIEEVLVVPSVNPYSLNTVRKYWPLDNTDINRMFPGYSEGETTQRIADAIMRTVQDYEYGVNLTSMQHPGSYVTHARVHHTGYESPGTALSFGLPFVHLHDPNPQETGSLNYNWQLWNTRAVSLLGGRGFAIDETQVEEIFHCVLRFMTGQGVLDPDASVPSSVFKGKTSRIVSDTDLLVLRTEHAGIFLSKCLTGDHVRKGDLLAEIVDTHLGVVRARIISPRDGVIFYAYTSPLVYAQMVAFRIA